MQLFMLCRLSGAIYNSLAVKLNFWFKNPFSFPQLKFIKMKRLFTPNLIPASRILGPDKPKFINKGILTLVLFISLLGLASSNLVAQPTIEWEKLSKGVGPELFVDLKQTTDGGYILGGTSISEAGGDKSEGTVGGTGNTDYWVVKLNAAGEKQWDNTLGGHDGDDLSALDATSDGGSILAGISSSNASGDKSENVIGTERNTWIVKLNAAGVKEWDKTIVGNFSFIEQTPDGGYVLFDDGRVLKLNADRSIAWDKTYTSAGAFQQTPDGGFIFFASGSAVKLDAAGNKIWEQPLAGIGNIPAGFGVVSIKPTADGGYILGGRAEDYYVIKLNSAGTKEWDKILGGPSTDWLRTVIQTADGGYLLGGSSYSGAGGDKSETNKGPYNSPYYYYMDYWVIKVDAAGNRVWDKTIGGIFNDDLRALQQTADGGFILGGMYDGSGYWAVKLASDITSPPNNLCNLALTSKVIQAEPWYGMYPGGGGSIDLTVTGGTPPYRYTWNHFPNSREDNVNLDPGLYTVLVTDAKGCTARGTVEIGKKNDPMRLHTSSLNMNVTNTGETVSSIDLSVVGGTGPYKYQWSNGATTEDLLFLAVGTYSVTVTDAFGRKATATVNIINPRNPTPTVICDIALTSKLTQAEPWYGSWPGGAGAIDLTVSGGTAPYTYLWNTGATGQDIAQAAPGVYSVTVTDAKSCKATTTVTVSRKNGPLSLTASHINVSGAGRQDGSIDLSVIGGVNPFKYLWSNGATSEDLTGLVAGTYTVTVTDAFGQKATLSVQVQTTGAATALAKKPSAPEMYQPKESGLTVFPNPVKEKANVAFKLKSAGKYSLDLYDIRGAKIKVLASGQAPGEKALTVEVNATDLAEGIYLLRLVTDAGLETKRISIQR
jgi:hypothetical protein